MSASIRVVSPPRVVSPLDDALARRLLSEACAPLVFDRVKLHAAAADFPYEGVGQHRLTASAGVVGVLEVNGLFQARRHQATGEAVGNGFREGRTFRVELGPGIASCASFDATRRERAWERSELGRTKAVDVSSLFDEGELGSASVGTVTAWSSKSRARMVRGFASVDWSGLTRCYCGELFTALCHSLVAVKRCDIHAVLPLAMVTLTYPGDWLRVAPTGKHAKRHLAIFRQRWARAMGWRLDGAWKLEFQRARVSGPSEGERAPHFHLLVPVPARVGSELFSAWLSRTWADCVGAVGDERVRHIAAGTGVDFSATAQMSDPKRLAVYFLKHGVKTEDDKEYQHSVAEAWKLPGAGPGRFWGFWGLRKATVSLDLGLADFVTVRRVLRRVAAARARSVKYDRARGAALSVGCSPAEATRLGVASAAVVKLPRGIRNVGKLRTLGVGGQLSGGWVIVNDGPALAAALGRAVWLRRAVVADGVCWY